MEHKELTHHGIKGQKWGVRRYQNPDGTLTAKGKKRYSAEMEKLKKEEQVLKNKQRTQAKVDKLLKKRQELDEMKRKMSGKDNDNTESKTTKPQPPNKPKSIKDMTDEELIAKINRMRLEQTYKALSPQTKTKGEEFVDKVLKPAGQKVANKLGDTILDKVNAEIRKKFGIDAGEDEMKALKKEAEKAGYEMKIRANKRDKDKDKTSSSNTKDSNESKKGDEEESFTGEVFGEGTSRRSNSGSNKTKRDDYYDPIYSTFNDVSDESPYSSSASTYRSSGKTAVTDLLSGPTGQYLLPVPRDDK